LGFEGKYSALSKIGLVDVASTECKWTTVDLLKNLELKFFSKDSKILPLNVHEENQIFNKLYS